MASNERSACTAESPDGRSWDDEDGVVLNEAGSESVARASDRGEVSMGDEGAADDCGRALRFGTSAVRTASGTKRLSGSELSSRG